MSSIHTILSAIKFYARSVSIYKVHSLFAYQLLDDLLDTRVYYKFSVIESLRNHLLQSKDKINLVDLGAGSQSSLSSEVSVADIARTSLSSKWQCEILYKLINHFKCPSVIELGSSLGISTAYLASATKGPVYALEGNQESLDIAQKISKSLKCKNVNFIAGNFDQSFPSLLSQLESVNFCFVDGNHREESTLQYFDMLLAKCNESSILVFDDIYWSSGMTKAWNQIKANKEVMLSLDFFYFGIIFFNKNLKSAQHLSIIPSKLKPWQKYL